MKSDLFNLTEEADESGGEDDGDFFLDSGNFESGRSDCGLMGTCGFSLKTGAFRLSVELRLDGSEAWVAGGVAPVGVVSVGVVSVGVAETGDSSAGP